MTTQDIINKYKGKKKEEKLFTLKHGRVVVGEVVDKHNKLHYVIRDGKNYTIESAWNQDIVQSSIAPRAKHISKRFTPHE